MFVGDHGEIISVGRFKLMAISLVFVIIIVVASAVCLYFFSKSYIEENLEMDVKELAESMDRSVKLVKAHVDKNTPKAQPEPKQEPKTMQLLARNADRGVVVMTESASSHFDENRKRPEPPRRYKGMIHKIKED